MATKNNMNPTNAIADVIPLAPRIPKSAKPAVVELLANLTADITVLIAPTRVKQAPKPPKVRLLSIVKAFYPSFNMRG